MKRIGLALSLAVALWSVHGAEAQGTWKPPVTMLTDDPAYTTPTLAIHSVLLHTSPTGRVRCIDQEEVLDNTNAHIVLVDVAAGTVQRIPPPAPPNDHVMFCGGHAHLGDSAGRILFAGGGGFCGHGFAQVEYKTSLYVPQMGGIGSFIAGPDEIWCRDPLDCPGTLGPTPRWYPTLTLRGNGHVLVFDGRCDDQCGPDCNATCINDLGRPSVPLLINAGAGDPSTWGDSVPLYDAGYNAPPAYPGNPCPDTLSPAGNDFNMGWYTNVYQLADGTMGMTGGRYEAWPNLDTRKLDTEQEEWTLVAESPVPTTAFGCSVMYRGNQVLRAGGGLNNPGHDVFVMDFAAQNPVWTARSPRPRDKDHFYLNDYRSLRHLPTGARFRSVVCPCMS